MEQNLSKKTRTESDLIGSREVPESALYGVQTLRGIENFRISKFHLNEYPLFIQALAITKMGATIANRSPDSGLSLLQCCYAHLSGIFLH
jgi:aspartate ammonia-lyase